MPGRHDWSGAAPQTEDDDWSRWPGRAAAEPPPWSPEAAWPSSPAAGDAPAGTGSADTQPWSAEEPAHTRPWSADGPGDAQPWSAEEPAGTRSWPAEQPDDAQPWSAEQPDDTQPWSAEEPAGTRSWPAGAEPWPAGPETGEAGRAAAAGREDTSWPDRSRWSLGRRQERSRHAAPAEEPSAGAWRRGERRPSDLRGRYSGMLASRRPSAEHPVVPDPDSAAPEAAGAPGPAGAAEPAAPEPERPDRDGAAEPDPYGRIGTPAPTSAPPYPYEGDLEDQSAAGTGAPLPPHGYQARYPRDPRTSGEWPAEPDWSVDPDDWQADEAGPRQPPYLDRDLGARAERVAGGPPGEPPSDVAESAAATGRAAGTEPGARPPDRGPAGVGPAAAGHGSTTGGRSAGPGGAGPGSGGPAAPPGAMSSPPRRAPVPGSTEATDAEVRALPRRPARMAGLRRYAARPGDRTAAGDRTAPGARTTAADRPRPAERAGTGDPAPGPAGTPGSTRPGPTPGAGAGAVAGAEPPSGLRPARHPGEAAPAAGGAGAQETPGTARPGQPPAAAPGPQRAPTFVAPPVPDDRSYPSEPIPGRAAAEEPATRPVSGPAAAEEPATRPVSGPVTAQRIAPAPIGSTGRARTAPHRNAADPVSRGGPAPAGPAPGQPVPGREHTVPAPAGPAREPRPGGTAGARPASTLPQRVPGPPDVPRVPEPEPEPEPAPGPPRVPGQPRPEPGELARIATYLRDDAEEPLPAEPFDVTAVLAAVRGVAGVRDAQLRAGPSGVHTLRLDLADGADPGHVSRTVARLLGERMGLAAEPRYVDPGPEAPRADGPPATDGDANGAAGKGAQAGAARAAGPAAPDRPVPTADRDAGAWTSGASAAEPAMYDKPARTSGPGPTAGDPDAPAQSAAVQPGDRWRVPRGRVARPPVTAPAPPPAPRGQPAAVRCDRLVLDQVLVSTLGPEATVEVRLTAGSETSVGVATGPAFDGYVLRLAAVAAGSALDKVLATRMGPLRETRCFIEHAGVVPFGTCEVAVVVVLLVSAGVVEQLSGSALVSGDSRQAVVEATLDAVNRRLETLPA